MQRGKKVRAAGGEVSRPSVKACTIVSNAGVFRGIRERDQMRVVACRHRLKTPGNAGAIRAP
jgi:hypothetical protein